MEIAPNDLTCAVTFDLSAGNVNLAYTSPRVLAPADGLAKLCEAAGEDATRKLGFSIGTAMGIRIAQLARLVSKAGDDTAGDDTANARLRELTTERFIEHLRGEFALAGLGQVRMELWGKAMLFVVRHTTMPASFIASVLDGALLEATNKSSACVQLTEIDGEMRFLAVGQKGAQRVSEWINKGVFWGEVLVRLQIPNPTTERGQLGGRA